MRKLAKSDKDRNGRMLSRIIQACATEDDIQITLGLLYDYMRKEQIFKSRYYTLNKELHKRHCQLIEYGVIPEASRENLKES